MKKTFILASLVFFVPVLALAQGSPGAQEAMNFVDSLNRVILFPLIGLLLAVAFFVFLLGCAQYIMGANNPMAREQGVKHITYGIIGLVIMVSAWSILSIAAGTFGLTTELEQAESGNIPGGVPAPVPGGGTTSPVPGGGVPGNVP